MARSVFRRAALGAVGILVVILASSSPALAQVIYTPVQYQYGQGQNVYYYGGSNPLVHYYANQPQGAAGTWGRIQGWNFASGNITNHREVSHEPTRTFVDAPGFMYANATFWGYTPDDARNDAYANATRYFRKADLLNGGYRADDGTWIVPADTIPLRSPNGAVYIGPSRRATTAPRPLMIIPKDSLKKQAPASDKAYASYR